MRKNLILGAIAALTASTALAAGPAEQRTRAALARIAAINPSLGAVIAIDPTAIEQAQRVDGSRSAGPPGQ